MKLNNHYVSHLFALNLSRTQSGRIVTPLFCHLRGAQKSCIVRQVCLFAGHELRLVGEDTPTWWNWSPATGPEAIDQLLFDRKMSNHSNYFNGLPEEPILRILLHLAEPSIFYYYHGTNKSTEKRFLLYSRSVKDPQTLIKAYPDLSNQLENFRKIYKPRWIFNSQAAHGLFNKIRQQSLPKLHYWPLHRIDLIQRVSHQELSRICHLIDLDPKGSIKRSLFKEEIFQIRCLECSNGFRCHNLKFPYLDHGNRISQATQNQMLN